MFFYFLLQEYLWCCFMSYPSPSWRYYRSYSLKPCHSSYCTSSPCSYLNWSSPCSSNTSLCSFSRACSCHSKEYLCWSARQFQLLSRGYRYSYWTCSASTVWRLFRQWVCRFYPSFFSCSPFCLHSSGWSWTKKESKLQSQKIKYLHFY